MFSNTSSSEETVIAEGLKIEGKVTADGLVRVHGKVIGDLCCTSLIVSEQAVITGTVMADEVEVDGMIDGPIRADDVVLKSQAHVTGDIHHNSLTVEKGARFEGRSKQSDQGKAKTKDKRGRPRKNPLPANDDASEAQANQVA